MKKFISIILLLSPFAVNANDTEVSLAYSLGITFGGDTLANTTNGIELEAGGMMYIAMGGVFKFSEDFHLQTNVGYHFDDLEASNGSASFTRTFVEVVPYYMPSSKTRIGLGVINAFSPEYKYISDTYGYDNALGIIGEINWQHSWKAWWGIRYVSIEYTVNSFNGFAVSNGPVTDGSYIGLMFHGGF